jgi:hypothetical protein
MRGVALSIVVTIIICACCYYGIVIQTPHQGNAIAAQWAMYFGLASALCWALSVVGALLSSTLAVIGLPIWNSWMNFFAAAFAAIAVGLNTPT